jgi:segregation and condensation protein A
VEPQTEIFEENAEQLIEQLKTYKKFKLSTEKLREMEKDAQAYFTREDSRDDMALFMEVNSIELWKSLVVVLERRASTRNLVFERPNIIIARKTKDVWDKIRKMKTLIFYELLSPNPSKLEIIATFIILLELARRKKISLQQEDHNKPLMIEKNHIPKIQKLRIQDSKSLAK